MRHHKWPSKPSCPLLLPPAFSSHCSPVQSHPFFLAQDSHGCSCRLMCAGSRCFQDDTDEFFWGIQQIWEQVTGGWECGIYILVTVVISPEQSSSDSRDNSSEDEIFGGVFLGGTYLLYTNGGICCHVIKRWHLCFSSSRIFLADSSSSSREVCFEAYRWLRGTIIFTPKIANPIKAWGWVLEYLEIRKMY